MAMVFTLLVSVLLASFGYVLHMRAEALREEEFFDRLEDRALLVERMIDEARGLPVDVKEHLEKALQQALPNEALSVIAMDGRILFQREAKGVGLQRSWLEQATRKGSVRVTQGDRQYVIIDTPEAARNGIRYTVASAVDLTGLRSLERLRATMLISGAIALLLTAVLSWAYAHWALGPVRSLVQRMGRIQEPSERIPIHPSHRADELGEISTTFNALLARLHEAFELQRSFIAGASHELRTPLTVIRGELQQAQQLAGDDPELRAKLHLIQDQAIQIQDLLSQLLWLARTHEGAVAIPMDELRLDELVDRAMERCRMRYPDRPVSLSMTAEEEDLEPLVHGNAVLLTAAVYNLLSNAAKYGGTGRIRLSIATGRQHVSACIGDDGPGMAPELVERVRKLFVRGDGTRGLEGHGIGLALVDRIARAHNGTFELITAPGKGTTACLHLPLARNASALHHQ
ncbi:MAG: HAMP domain-containing histidine kinase [Flavobacteriales bacterium]|nr:HAMP domain-containing histidine kinase [Flavobacteriales bacterium]